MWTSTAEGLYFLCVECTLYVDGPPWSGRYNQSIRFMIILVVVGDNVMSNEKEIDLEAKKCIIDEELQIEPCADVIADEITTSITTEGKNSDNTGKLFFLAVHFTFTNTDYIKPDGALLIQAEFKVYLVS